MNSIFALYASVLSFDRRQTYLFEYFKLFLVVIIHVLKICCFNIFEYAYCFFIVIFKNFYVNGNGFFRNREIHLWLMNWLFKSHWIFIYACMNILYSYIHFSIHVYSYTYVYLYTFMYVYTHRVTLKDSSYNLPNQTDARNHVNLMRSSTPSFGGYGSTRTPLDAIDVKCDKCDRRFDWRKNNAIHLFPRGRIRIKFTVFRLQSKSKYCHQ